MIAALQFRGSQGHMLQLLLKRAVSRSAVEHTILDVPPVVAELAPAWLRPSA